MAVLPYALISIFIPLVFMPLVYPSLVLLLVSGTGNRCAVRRSHRRHSTHYGSRSHRYCAEHWWHLLIVPMYRLI